MRIWPPFESLRIEIWAIFIDKLCIDGPCGSKILAGVFLEKEWVTWLTFIIRTNKEQSVCSIVGLCNLPNQIFPVQLGPGISWLQKCSVNNLYFDLLINDSHGPSMYILSVAILDFKVYYVSTVNPALLSEVIYHQIVNCKKNKGLWKLG